MLTGNVVKIRDPAIRFQLFGLTHIDHHTCFVVRANSLNLAELDHRKGCSVCNKTFPNRLNFQSRSGQAVALQGSKCHFRYSEIVETNWLG